MMLKPAVIGKDGRTTALIRTLEASSMVGPGGVLYLSDWKHPDGVEEAARELLEKARAERPDFVVVGPEDPLEFGIVDRLQELDIPCIGPTKALAKLESSKAFTRNLLAKYGIPGNPEYRDFSSMAGVEAYLRRLESEGGYVVKGDGLMGGKGVKVSGDHLFSVDEAMEFCRELLSKPAGRVVVEEKLDGEEFSLMSFCDGRHVSDMVPVQDHKRAGEGDTGPNTGGMGSYSCEDHLLPFLTRAQLQEASAINAAVAEALLKETGQPYKGILYGGFMVTGKGLRLLEYNARFGDPETLNVLSVLKTDLVEIFQAMIAGSLDAVRIEFRRSATVCKYIVPEGYPDKSVKGVAIDLSAVPPDSGELKRFEASLDEQDGRFFLAGSRALALVGIGADLAEAERIAESAARAVKGPVQHRRDIGTAELVNRRVEHIAALARP